MKNVAYRLRYTSRIMVYTIEDRTAIFLQRQLYYSLNEVSTLQVKPYLCDLTGHIQPQDFFALIVPEKYCLVTSVF